MMRALHDYRWIWRVTTSQRNPRAMRILTRSAQVLLAIGGIGAVAAQFAGKLNIGIALHILLGILGFWLAIAWSALFVPGAMLLNTPANAQLMPRQRRRLQQMTAGGWLLSTAAVSAMIGSWGAVPLVASYLLGFPLIRAGNHRATALIFVSVSWPWLSRQVLPPSLVDDISTTPSLLALCALLLVAGAWALRWLYPAGGDAWLDQRGDRLQRLQRVENKNGGSSVDVGGLAGWTRKHVYGAALRRDCRHPRADAMLMHALGPLAHWSAWLPAVAVIAALAIGVQLLLFWRGADALREFVQGPGAAMQGGLVMGALFITVQLSKQVSSNRGEQGLLRLTPLAGDAATLNRRLAGQLLKAALRNWLLVTAGILVASLLFGDPGAVLRQVALCCLAGQVAMLGLLGDYAHKGGWELSLALQGALLAVLEVAAALGLAWALGTSPWPWIAAIAIPAAAIQTRQSWRRMLAAPPAFPAGRLA